VITFQSFKAFKDKESSVEATAMKLRDLFSDIMLGVIKGGVCGWFL